MSTTIPPTPETFIDSPRAGDFERIVNLLSQLGEANRKLGELTRIIETEYVALVTPHRETYAALQATVTETEAALEVIARRNPQWFAEKKSVKTPFGAVKFTSSSELIVVDENISVQLIQAIAGKEGVGKYLRTVQVLNKEALEKLPDAELAKYGLGRKTKENFGADTEVVDLGKAVKAIDKSNRAANRTAAKAAELAGGAAA